jgi:hypothetical protein
MLELSFHSPHTSSWRRTLLISHRDNFTFTISSVAGHAVTYLVEALRYKPEVRGIESRWGGFFFNLPNPSSRTMALRSTKPLTEMSTRNLPWGKGRPAHMADHLTAICEPIVQKMWEPRRLTTLWASTACYRDSFTFIISVASFWKTDTTVYILIFSTRCRRRVISPSSVPYRWFDKPTIHHEIAIVIQNVTSPTPVMKAQRTALHLSFSCVSMQDFCMEMKLI